MRIMRNNARSIKYIAIPWTVYVLFYLGRMNLPALIPAIIEKYGFTATHMGIATSSLFLAYTLFQMPSGFLGDRFGVKIVLTTGALLIAVGNLVVTTWIFPAIVLGMFINGIGQSTGWGPLVKISSKGGGKAIALLGSSVPIGTSLAFILAKTLAEYDIELSFYVPAAIMLLLAIVLALKAPEEGGGGSFAFIKDSRIIILSFTQFAVFFAMIGTFTWAALYLTTFDVSSLKAAGYASIFPLSGVIGAVIGGIFAERFGAKKTITWNQLLAAASFAALPFSHNLFQAILILFIASTFFRFGVGATYWLATKIAGEENTASVSGFLVFSGNVGSVISGVLSGFLIDVAGFAPVFFTFAAIFALSGIASIKLAE